eukprot:4874085-Lingulodinium_polyedra.AAC.1
MPSVQDGTRWPSADIMLPTWQRPQLLAWVWHTVPARLVAKRTGLSAVSRSSESARAGARAFARAARGAGGRKPADARTVPRNAGTTAAA